MRRPLFAVCLCLVVLAALRPARYQTREMPLWEEAGISSGETISVTGRVCSKNTQSYIIEISELSSATVSWQTFPNQSKLICENTSQEDVLLGSIIVVRGSFQEFRSATNPGEFDAETYYLTHKIIGRLRDVTVVGKSREYSQVQEFLYELRCYFKERLYEIFPKKEASVMTAMLLGDKEELNSEIKSLYKENGVIHILSISGLHITMIGMGIYRVLRRMGVPLWMAAVVGGIILCFYGVMTGMSLSATRAIGMYLIRMLGVVAGRTYDMLTALGVMAGVMLWQNPENLKNVGFLLSFGAVLGISVCYPALQEKESQEPCRLYESKRWKRIMKLLCREGVQVLKESMISGISVTLVTLPIQLWFYFEIPIYSVVVNLLVLPWMSLLMITGLVAMILPGAGVVGSAGYYILCWYEWICKCFEALPYHTWNPGRPEIWQMVSYYIILGMVIYLGNKLKKKKWISGCLLFVAVFVLTTNIQREDRITFLDVGQGDGIVVELKTGEVFLFDCGSMNREQVGQYVLLPYLKYRGISKIDAVFLSHNDKDHSSGIKELLENGQEEGIRIGQLVLSGDGQEIREICSNAGIPLRTVEAGEGFATEEASFLCLHPPAGFVSEDKNAESQCFYVQIRNIKLLLTGDVQGEGEGALLQELIQRGISHISVLKVSHHGSANASGEALLEQINPRVAVISCGRNNVYGHPHKEVLERLEAAGSMTWITAESGAVTVVVEPEGNLKIEQFIRNQRRK